MKKIILLLLLLNASSSYGGVSVDMSEYVRRDLFDVQMRNLTANMERVLQKLDSLESKVNNMSDRITGLSARIDGIDVRIGDLRNDIYLGLVILGILAGFPAVQKMFTVVRENRSSITLEDVKRLIEENNAKLEGKI